MDKTKEITNLAIDIDFAPIRLRRAERMQIAETLVNIGYKRVDDDKVVITKAAFERFQKLEEAAAKKRKIKITKI